MASLHAQVAGQYTDSQQQDMLHVRRLFYGKLGQLSRERDNILQQQIGPQPRQSFSLDFKHAAAKNEEVQQMTARLSANRAEESQMYIYCGMCLLLVRPSAC